jgi:hypothetical protein
MNQRVEGGSGTENPWEKTLWQDFMLMEIGPFNGVVLVAS